MASQFSYGTCGELKRKVWRSSGVVGGVKSREACDLRLGHGHYIFEKGAML